MIAWHKGSSGTATKYAVKQYLASLFGGGLYQSSIFERRWKFISIPGEFNPFKTKVRWHGAKAVAQPLCSAAVASQGCLVAFAKSIPVYSYSSTYYVYIAHR